jgi:hypothetical protein
LDGLGVGFDISALQNFFILEAIGYFLNTIIY